MTRKISLFFSKKDTSLKGFSKWRGVYLFVIFSFVPQFSSFPIMQILGAFVWDQSGIRVIGITRVSVCLGAILIPEYLDFHSGYLLRKS